jgi:uncharacterized delta-60 repeat protein
MFSRRLLVTAALVASVTVVAAAAPAYAASGDLDSTFGNGGKVKSSFTSGWDSANGVAIQSDGKILAAGQVDGVTFAVARYLPGGTLDAGFGTGGLKTVPGAGSGAYANAVVVQSSGKTAKFALARYLP